MKKRVVTLLLALVLLFPHSASSLTLPISCMPQDTFQAVFSLTSKSGKPDIVIGKLEYNTDVFDILLSESPNVTPTGGIFFYGDQSVSVFFRVRAFVPEGTYLISINILSVDGNTIDQVSISPIQVDVRKSDFQKQEDINESSHASSIPNDLDVDSFTDDADEYTIMRESQESYPMYYDYTPGISPILPEIPEEDSDDIVFDETVTFVWNLPSESSPEQDTYGESITWLPPIS